MKNYKIKLHSKKDKLRYIELYKKDKKLLSYDYQDDKVLYWTKTSQIADNRVINTLLRGSNFRAKWNMELLENQVTFKNGDSITLEDYSIEKMISVDISFKTYVKKGLKFYLAKIKDNKQL